MVVVNLAATILFIFLNADILPRRQLTIAGSILHKYKKRNLSNDVNDVCLILILKIFRSLYYGV